MRISFGVQNLSVKKVEYALLKRHWHYAIYRDDDLIILKFHYF